MLFRSLRNFFYQSSCSFCVFITFCLAFGNRESGTESVIITQANFGDMSFLKRPSFICEKQLNERFINFNITGFWFYQICQIKSTIIPLNLSTPASLFLKSILKSPINIMFSCLSLCVYVCVFTSIHHEGFICLDHLGYQETDQQCYLEDVNFLCKVPSSLL